MNEPEFLPNWYHLAWPVSLLLQIILVVHVIKTGRPYWWIWLILFFPFVGAGAYLLIEIAPDFSRFSVHNLQWKLKTPGQRIAALKEAIEESDTFANRTALAEEYYRQKRYDEAAQLLKACLTGPYQNDAYALMDLAECYFASGKYTAAKEVLGRVDISQVWELENRKTLLAARTLEALGSKRPAGELYQTIYESYPGEEPRYRYAVLLIELGKKDQARALLQGVLNKYRKAGPRWRKEQKMWHRLAKAKLKTLPIK